jgi:hypothetical protein
MAVLERIHSEFDNPPLFYQEPRVVNGERLYLKSRNFHCLPADSLQTVPEVIAEQMSTGTDINLVFMIHFDHYGFERLLASLEALDMQSSLMFIGNCVPIDYIGELPAKLEFCFDCLTFPLPLKPTNGSTQKDKSLLWWRKAFSNTAIYNYRLFVSGE